MEYAQEHDFLENVHVVRAPVTEKDFDERPGALPVDDIERQVLEEGTAQEIIDRRAHTIRYVQPALAETSCIERCHESAEVGDVLGVTSITVRTHESDAARTRLNWIVTIALIAAAIIEIIFVVIMLTKEI